MSHGVNMITTHTDWCMRRLRRTTRLLLHGETRAETLTYLAHHSYWLVMPWVREAFRSTQVTNRGHRGR